MKESLGCVETAEHGKGKLKLGSAKVDIKIQLQTNRSEICRKINSDATGSECGVIIAKYPVRTSIGKPKI